MSAGDVLVVDDDPDMTDITRLVLSNAGYVVRCAENGKRALELVEEHKPQLILLDMLMPVMDGWSTARELHKRYGDAIPSVVVTAAEHARARGDDVGADAVLAKPYEIDDLLETVARYTIASRPD